MCEDDIITRWQLRKVEQEIVKWSAVTGISDWPSWDWKQLQQHNLSSKCHTNVISRTFRRIAFTTFDPWIPRVTRLHGYQECCRWSMKPIHLFLDDAGLLVVSWQAQPQPASQIVWLLFANGDTMQLTCWQTKGWTGHRDAAASLWQARIGNPN